MNNYPPPPPSGPGGPPPPPPPGSGWGGPPPPPPPPPGWGGGSPPPGQGGGYGGPGGGYGGGAGGPGGPAGPGGPGGGYGGGPGGPGGYGPAGGGGGYGGQPGGPQYGQPSFGGPPPPPEKKRGALPWILGCVGCGGIILIAIIAALVIPQLAKHRRGGGGEAMGDTTGTVRYTSSEENLIPSLREHYVPFSFRYPDDWKVVERGDSAGGSNFVKVEKSNDGFTAENFAVGYMYTTPGHENDPELLNQILTQFQQQFAQSFPNFRRVGDDHLELAGRQATGFKFTSRVHTASGKDVDVFGRALVLPVGNGRGLSFVMLGTPEGSGLHSLDDLGVKGGLPVILRTFRVGEVDASGEAGKPSDGGAPGDTSTEPPTEGKPSVDQGQQPSTEEPQIKEIKPLNRDSF